MPDNQQIPSGFYFNLFENSKDAILIMKHYRVSECNSAALRFFECDRSNIIGKSMEELSATQADKEPPAELAVQYQNSALQGVLKDYEWTFETATGRKITSRVLVSASDIESSQLQLIIREKARINVPEIIGENEIANLVLNIFPGLFFIYDITGGLENANLLSFNRKWYHEKLGYTSADFPGSFPRFIFSPSEETRTSNILKELKAYKYADFEINIRHKEGYDIPYLFVANLIETESSIYFTGIGIDIWERKYTEFALKQSEEYFKNIFNSSNDGIMVMDLDYKLLNANSTLLRMFEYKFEDIAFQNVLDFIPPATRQIIEARTQQLLKDELMPPIELEVRKSSGELLPVEINSIIIRYGERTGILTTVRDLTERKMLEQQIFNSEILSEERERERFAKELHDGLGPILSTCKIYLHSLNEMLADQRDFLKISERALILLDDALASIKEISNNLSPHVLRNFGLVQAVIAFTHNLENISDLKFEVHYNYDERLNEIIEFTAYRIITELINNSVKYAEASLIVIDINLNKPHLSVSYSDNGKGFDPETNTKQKRGFGLSNIETRISKFNGDYSYKTAPGKGVKVNFTLETNYAEK